MAAGGPDLSGLFNRTPISGDIACRGTFAGESRVVAWIRTGSIANVDSLKIRPLFNQGFGQKTTGRKSP
jgi:hypothetical protein